MTLKMRPLLPLILLLTVTLAGEARSDPAYQLEHSRLRLILEVSLVLKSNLVAELYFSNFQEITEVHATRCGIMRVCDPDLLEVSYSYFPWMLNLSVWHAGTREFVARGEDRAYLAEHISMQQGNYEESGLVPALSFESWYRLHVVEETWWRYLDFLRDAYMVGDLSDTDLQEAVESMGQIWGLEFEPDPKEHVCISYEFVDGLLTTVMTYDGEEFASRTDSLGVLLGSDFRGTFTVEAGLEVEQLTSSDAG